jgi:signal transduction histidine kinase/CheY-like chemotaxis protein
MDEQLQHLEERVATALTPIDKITALTILAWELRDLAEARATQYAQAAYQLANAGEFAHTPYSVVMAHSLTTLSYLNFRADDFARSLAQALEAIHLLEAAQAPLWLPKLYNILSLNHGLLGNRAEEIDCLLKQLALSQALGDENMEGTAYHDLGLSYHKLRDHEKALDYLARAQILFERTGDRTGDIFILHTRSRVLLALQRYAEAEGSALGALRVARDTGYQYGEVMSLQTLGEISRVQGRIAQAFTYYQQALTLAQHSTSLDLLRDAQQALGELCLHEGAYAVALHFAQEALATAEKMTTDPAQLEAQRLLAKIYKAQGDYPATVGRLEAVQQLTERVFNTENERRTRALVVLHQTEAAQREAELLREKNAALEHEIAERQRTEQALIQAQKMESLGVLAGGVAHDFNNLLTSMIGQTALARYKLPNTHEAVLHLEKAQQSMQRATDLARQMLAYSGQGHFVVTVCNLNQVIEENFALLRTVTQQALTMELALAPDLPSLEADPGQLYQVLVNLIVNAREAEATALRIITATSSVTAADHHYWQYTGQALIPGDYVTLTVADNGRGMSAETRQRLFDPFYTTKFTGRGLGLASVLGIIRGHRGGITVQSQPERGSTFTILVPSVQATAAPLLRPKASPFASPLTSGALLVIDDEQSVCEMISAALGDQVTIFTANDGADGVEQLRQHQAVIKVVLLDILMSGLNGWETLPQLRKINPQLPVILTSGYPQTGADERLADDPLTQLMPKPFSLDALLTTVQTYL